MPVREVSGTMMLAVIIYMAREHSVQCGMQSFCGEIGEVHVEKEVRMEMILPAFKKTAVTRALLSVHPYEEPAFDFIRYQHMGTGRFRCSGRVACRGR